jgi:hypothetical protein
MKTVLEELLKISVLFCVLLWAKGLNAKDIHKEMFPVYGGKCLPSKAVENVSLMMKTLKWKCGTS